MRFETLPRFAALAVAALLLFACGDDDPGADASTTAPGDGDGDGDEPDTGPFAELPADETLADPSLSAQVDIVRDVFGIPHVYAATLDDLMFANGFISAKDRIAQMDLFRRVATGTVAELFGTLRRSTVATDLEMRMHRLAFYAQQSFDELAGSTAPSDIELVSALERYADGVNTFAQQVRDGRAALDPAVDLWFDADAFRTWTAVDSLTIARLQAWNLSYSEADIRVTDAYQAAEAEFSPDNPDSLRAARAGLFFDLFSPRPIAATSTIDGFPNVEQDTGTRALAPAKGTRPRVPREILRSALETLRPRAVFGFTNRHPDSGSNNWVVASELAGGDGLLANDPHLGFASPSIFYPIHLVADGDLELEGVAFPGIPGIILGRNGRVAWGGTVSFHDVTDVYLEEIAPCSSDGLTDCVAFNGGEVPIERLEEEVRVGFLGSISETVTATYEVVPHHGPIIPIIRDNEVVPRTANRALSVKFTGYQSSQDIRAVSTLWRTQSVPEAVESFEEFAFGSQNWVLVDDAGDIGWTTMARVPLRSPECFSFDAESRPDGLAPFFVLPGDGTCEWEGFLDPRYIPHSINPPQGFLATANGDPVGVTFDGNPLNGPEVAGRPLYVGSYTYADGLRMARITDRMQALVDEGRALTVDDMASIQGDAHSNLGERLRGSAIAAVAAMEAERESPGTRPDVADFVAGLSEPKVARLSEAAARLADWSLDTPPAVLGAPTADEVSDSVATSIFNHWIVMFNRMAFGDELSALGFGVSSGARAAYFALAEPESLATGLAPETGEPILCDDLDTGEIESCTLIALMAFDSALERLEGTFATAEMDQWRWGALHRLTIPSLLPAPELDIPPADDPIEELRRGYPRQGDGGAVDASHPGWNDFDFTFGSGPAMRHIVRFSTDGPRTFLALPGGASSDRSTGHFRDLMDEYWFKNEYLEFPDNIPEVIEKAESRLRMRP